MSRILESLRKVEKQRASSGGPTTGASHQKVRRGKAWIAPVTVAAVTVTLIGAAIVSALLLE